MKNYAPTLLHNLCGNDGFVDVSSEDLLDFPPMCHCVVVDLEAVPLVQEEQHTLHATTIVSYLWSGPLHMVMPCINAV